MLPGWGDRFNAVSTRLNGKYVRLGRAPTKLKGRWMWRIESQDLVHRSQPVLVLKKDVEDPSAMQYYSATALPYDGMLPYPLNYGGIGLALLRVDGFASICAKEKAGHVLTPPIHWPDADLCVNVDPRRDLASHPRFESGEVRVEVRDLENHSIAGFTWDECEPIRSNTVDALEGCSQVTWRNGRPMRELPGRVIRLAFQLYDAHLYSFRAIPGGDR